jgi:Putative metallopeptidase
MASERLVLACLLLIPGCDVIGRLTARRGEQPTQPPAVEAPTPTPTPAITATAPPASAPASSIVPGPTQDVELPAVADVAGAGTFQWVFSPAKQAGLRRYEALFSHHRLESVVGVMGMVTLPRTVPVVPLECGAPNAFYAPKKHGVVICYELADAFYRSFLARGADDQSASDSTLNALTFVLLHELGHAVIGELELGITGGEEDAVDDLAAVLLVDAGHAEWAFDGARSMTLLSTGTPAPYFDEHSMGEQRFYNVTCVVFGSDPMQHLALVERGLLPRQRAARCPKEYEQKDKAWQDLLGTHLRTKK